MPLYEYECEACSHRFESIQKFSDPPIERCPRCGGTVHKLVSSPAFQFKGTGWYATDYAKKAEPPSAAKDVKDTKDASASKNRGETKESKPAASSESAPSSQPTKAS
jgi:putative FmdB family regulatory protein